MKKLISIFLLMASMSLATVIDNTLEREGTSVVKNKYEYSKFGITNNILKGFNNEYFTNWKVDELTYKQAKVVAREMVYEKNNIDLIRNETKQVVVFDFVFNSGGAGKVIQRVCNDYILEQRRAGNYSMDYLKVDGVLGSKSIGVINKIPPGEFVEALTVARLSYVRKLKNYSANASGWEHRIKTIFL